VSVATTFKDTLNKAGVIFCSFSDAVRDHPELVRKYLGSVVPHTDNFFATLNSAVFSDGSFVYIPKGVRCPMELSTYFRINALNTGQFERTRLFTSFLGGMGREAIIGMSEEEIFATAVSDFRTVTKANSLPIGLHRTWMPAWDRSWGALDGLELPAGIHFCSAFSGRPGIPGRLEQARQVVTGIGSALHS
jgi:hypothetical protein